MSRPRPESSSGVLALLCLLLTGGLTFPMGARGNIFSRMFHEDRAALYDSYDWHYEDDSLVSGPRKLPRRNERSAPLKIPSQNCSCGYDGQVSCTGKAEEGWMVEAAVASVCPILMETRLARKEMQCELMRIMGRLWVKRYMRDSAWGGMCEDNIEVEAAASRSAQPQGADAGEKDDEDDNQPNLSPEDRQRKVSYIRQLSLTAWLVSVRAAVATMPMLRAPGQRDLFYTRANAELRRPASDQFDSQAMKYLPPTQPALRNRFATCAIVGNGASLLTGQNGPEIDRHDFVIRLNQGPTLPNYVVYSGERTDARVLNRKFTAMYGGAGRNWLDDDPEGTTYISIRASVKQFASLAQWIEANHTDKDLLFVHSDLVWESSALLSAFRNAFQVGLDTRAGGHKAINPSTGFLAVHLATQMCSNVTIFGFPLASPECKDKTGNCEGFHYFDAKKHNMLDRPGTRATKYHQLGLEGWLLKAYHALGVVCTMGVKGLGYCGHHMGPLVDSMGRISPSWPSLKEILSDTEMKALFEWQPPKEEAPKRQSELQDWVSTPGHGESMTADFVKKRPAKRIDYRRSRVRTKFVGRPQQRTRWGLPLRHRHASKVESNGPAEVIGDADIQ